MSTPEWILRGPDATPATPSFDALSEGEKAYIALVADYSLHSGWNDAMGMLAGEEFTVDGIDLRLIYVPQRQPDILGICCDVGEIPVHLEEHFYRRLLMTNAARFDGRTPVMALCEETGMAISSARLPVAGLSAAGLDALIRAMAADALAWQQEMAGLAADAARPGA